MEMRLSNYNHVQSGHVRPRLYLLDFVLESQLHSGYAVVHHFVTQHWCCASNRLRMHSSTTYSDQHLNRNVKINKNKAVMFIAFSARVTRVVSVVPICTNTPPQTRPPRRWPPPCTNLAGGRVFRTSARLNTHRRDTIERPSQNRDG